MSFQLKGSVSRDVEALQRNGKGPSLAGSNRFPSLVLPATLTFCPRLPLSVIWAISRRPVPDFDLKASRETQKVSKHGSARDHSPTR